MAQDLLPTEPFPGGRRFDHDTANTIWLAFLLPVPVGFMSLRSSTFCNIFTREKGMTLCRLGSTWWLKP